MLDVTRVTVLGGGKRKVATKDRRGAVMERYDVRWRVQLRSGDTRMFRQRFDRSVDADGLVRRLQAVGLPASGWRLDDDGRPSDEPVSVGSRAERLTVWSALQLYRGATWRGASANGRKAAALTLRATARVLKPNAPRVPPATHAYLDLVAFRGAVEPATVDEFAEKYEYRQGMFSGGDLLAGRKFLERWSLPVADLDRDHVRRLIAELGHGCAAASALPMAQGQAVGFDMDRVPQREIAEHLAFAHRWCHFDVFDDDLLPAQCERALYGPPHPDRRSNDNQECADRQGDRRVAVERTPPRVQPSRGAGVEELLTQERKHTHCDGQQGDRSPAHLVNPVALITERILGCSIGDLVAIDGVFEWSGRV